jgi:hypothetical protein
MFRTGRHLPQIIALACNYENKSTTQEVGLVAATILPKDKKPGYCQVHNRPSLAIIPWNISMRKGVL